MIDSEFCPAFSENNIPVVIFASNYYAPYAGVFIKSLLDCSSSNKNYDIIVCERDMSQANKLLIKSLMAEHTNISIRFINPYYAFSMADVDIEAFQGTSPYPIEVYCKIWIPYVLRKYDKLVMVDTDTILRRDIADLFAMDLEGNCLGGVRDITWEGYYRNNYIFSSLYNMTARDFCHKVIGVEQPEFINGGLYLIDTKQYCENLSIKQISHLLHSNNASLCADDTILSSALADHIKFLPMAWNTYVPVNRRTEAAIKAASDDIQTAHQQAYMNPYLLHWAGKPKPWVCPDVPYGNEWWKVAMKTPFMGHIIARMVDALEVRRDYYRKTYGADGEKVAVWDPIPKNVKQFFGR